MAQEKAKTIVETYPLAEAPKAYERVAEGKARFPAVHESHMSERSPNLWWPGHSWYVAQRAHRVDSRQASFNSRRAFPE